MASLSIIFPLMMYFFKEREKKKKAALLFLWSPRNPECLDSVDHISVVLLPVSPCSLNFLETVTFHKCVLSTCHVARSH